MRLKKLLLSVLCFTAAFTVTAKDDPEEHHVRVVLLSGDTISGYLRNDAKTVLKNIFSKTGGDLRQYINLGEEPKGGETKRYNSSEVKYYQFLEPTEGYPDGAVMVSERINSPPPFKPNYCVRGFAWECDKRESGSILRWDIWQTNAVGTRVLVPVVGVKFKGAKAAYGIILNGQTTLAQLLFYLKKQNPDFKKYLEEYYHKGKDSKAHRKELNDNPSTILLRYEEFLETNPPIADPDEDSDLKKEKKNKKKKDKDK